MEDTAEPSVDIVVEVEEENAGITKENTSGKRKGRNGSGWKKNLNLKSEFLLYINHLNFRKH